MRRICSNVPLRALLGVLLALLFVMTPVAEAQTITTTACASTATPPSASGIISFDAFVPNAGCWIKETFRSIKSFGIMKLMAQFGQIILFALFMINSINAWINRSVGGFVRAALISAVASVLVTDAMVGGTWTNKVYTLPMDAWSKVYVGSNKVVGKFMRGPQGVEQQTKDMAKTILDFTSYAFMGVNSMAAYNIGDLFTSRNDPEALKAAGSQASEAALSEMQKRAETDRAQIDKMTWVFQIGYLLLLTFFMAFAGLMYLSAMSVVIGMFALPVALAMWGGGSSRPLQVIVATWMVAIATAGVAPVMMAIATQLALNEPTKYMKAQIAPLTAAARSQVKQYDTVAQSCNQEMSQLAVNVGVGGIGKDIKPADNALSIEACSALKGMLPMAKALGSSVFQVIIGFLVMCVTMSVTMAVGAQLLRSIPGLFAQILNGIGVASQTPSLMQAAGAAASSSAMLAGARMGGGGGGGGGGGLVGGAIRGAAGGIGGAAVGAGRAMIGAAGRAPAAAAAAASAGRNLSAGAGALGAGAGNALNAAKNSAAGQALGSALGKAAATPAGQKAAAIGQSVSSAASTAASRVSGAAQSAGHAVANSKAGQAAQSAGQTVAAAGQKAQAGLAAAAASPAGQSARTIAGNVTSAAGGALEAGRNAAVVAGAKMQAAYAAAQANGGALTDRGITSMAGSAMSGAASVGGAAARGGGDALAAGVDRSSGKSGELGLQSAGPAQAVQDSANDQVAARTLAAQHAASGNVAPDAQGRTGTDKAYHELAAQGALPSQQDSDARNAAAFAASYNASEQSKAASNPAYTPQTMSQGEAAGVLKAAGKDSAAQYQAAQQAKATAATSRADQAAARTAQAQAWSSPGAVSAAKADAAQAYTPTGRAAHAGNPTVRQQRDLPDTRAQGRAAASQEAAAIRSEASSKGKPAWPDKRRG